jgi:hypothetical protein
MDKLCGDDISGLIRASNDAGMVRDINDLIEKMLANLRRYKD